MRHPAGESDFTRAARQQEVLSGVRDRIVGGKFLNDPIGLVRALGKTVSTNVPRKRLPEFVDLAVKIDRKSTYRTVIKYPLVRGAYDERGSIQVPNVKEIRKLAKRLFTSAGETPDKDFKVGGGTKTGRGHDVRDRQLRGGREAEAAVDAEADSEADPEADAETDRRSRRPPIRRRRLIRRPPIRRHRLIRRPRIRRRRPPTPTSHMGTAEGLRENRAGTFG